MVPADSATRHRRARGSCAPLTGQVDCRRDDGGSGLWSAEVGVHALPGRLWREDPALALGKAPPQVERHN